MTRKDESDAHLMFIKECLRLKASNDAKGHLVSASEVVTSGLLSRPWA